MTTPALVQRYRSLLSANYGVIVVCVATAISMTGQGVITPVLPVFTREFGVGATFVGVAVGVFGLARLVLNLPAGLIGQRFGRRLLMGVGLLLSGTGTGLVGISGSIPELVAWRFLAGAGSAMYVTGAMSYIADVSTRENRARLMGLQQSSLLLGTDIGPTIGGFVADTLGFRWPFFLAGLLAATAAAWVFFRLPDVRASAQGAPASGQKQKGGSWDLSTIKLLLTNPTFLLVSGFTLLVFFTRTGSRQTLLPLVAVERLDISNTQLGLIFTVMTTINLLCVMPTGYISDRFGRKALVLPGTLLSFLGLGMFALGNSLWMFHLAGIVLGLGTGIIGPAPAAYAGDLAPPGKAGVTMGLYRTFGDLGFIIGPVLLGLVADATSGMSAHISGSGIAMVLNAVLLTVVALALVVAARETAGRGQASAPRQSTA